MAKYETNTFKCKVNLDLNIINHEKQGYADLPRFYDFGSEENTDTLLLENLKMIYAEIESI